MNVRIDAKITTYILSSIVILLSFSHFLLIIATFKLGYYNEIIFDYINLDDEQNMPTFFASSMILFCSFILFIIFFYHKQEGNKEYKYWLGLAAVFLFLALDESSKIHEKVIDVYWVFFGQSANESSDNYVWVIAYGIVALIIAALYYRFVISQPRKTCILIFLSASLYIFGAIGMEVLASIYVDQSWFRENPANDYSYFDGKYFIMSGTEETLEMLGILIFIYTLLSYIEVKWQGLYIICRLPDDKTPLN